MCVSSLRGSGPAARARGKDAASIACQKPAVMRKGRGADHGMEKARLARAAP
ncbi:MAG: hypothetical protein QMC82_01895 [Methanolinea sp.]|nr:hypothetical protein [Methanolinea sp.]